MSRARLARRTIGAWRIARREPPAGVRIAVDRLPAPDSLRLHAALAEALERVRPPGAQVVIRRRGNLLWSACAGRVNREQPVAPEDRFVLASATKLATACLVALLAERGALHLDDPVGNWLPQLPRAGRLTPRLLLAHRSGLREYTKDRALARLMNGGAPDHRWSRDELLAAIARLGPEREPGERFAYRNSNYVVAAELAERAAGRDFESLLAELIARPLGLSGFSFARTSSGSRLATPHLALLRRPVDLLAVTGGLIPNDALGRKRGYGLGVMTSPLPGAVHAGHDGMYYGWTASTGIDDATATTVAVVANLAGASVPAARLAKAVRAALPLRA